MKIKIKKFETVGLGRLVGSTVPVDRWSADSWMSFNRAMGTIAPTEDRTMKDLLHLHLNLNLTP